MIQIIVFAPLLAAIIMPLSSLCSLALALNPLPKPAREARKDPKMREWYRRIKLRRGSKIARVAVMRRITTAFWHMLKHDEAYSIGGPPPRLRRDPKSQRSEAA